MNSLLDSARAISHTLLSHYKEEITDKILLQVINKVSAMNIIEGQQFDERELFDLNSATLL